MHTLVCMFELSKLKSLMLKNTKEKRKHMWVYLGSKLSNREENRGKKCNLNSHSPGQRVQS